VRILFVIACLCKPLLADKIVDYFLDADGRELVVINMGQGDGLKVGSLLTTRRQDFSGIYIDTGMLKVSQVSLDSAICDVVKTGTELSSRAFVDYPGVMSGDLVQENKRLIRRNPILSPKLRFSYFELFSDPKPQAEIFALKAGAEEYLTQQLKAFAESKASTILISGYTDRLGKVKESLEESKKRVQTIRQFLILNLGFDAARVIAVGYGEDEYFESMNSVNQAETNRRIEIKILTANLASHAHL
jgi:hypothetical protein